MRNVTGRQSLGPCLAVAVFVIAAPAGAACAAEKVVDTVLGASVDAASERAGMVTLRARVRLDNTCLSHPRFVYPGSKVTADDAGVLSVEVMARSTEGAGNMCAMHATDVDVPPLTLKKRALAGVKSIRVTGSRQPALARIDLTPE